MADLGGSVSRWLDPLQAGNPEAAELLWQRYFQQLIGLARKALRDLPNREVAEDVALSAFDSFCRNARAGRFPKLADRESLWRLLVMITARKVGHHKRDARRQKRGGGLARTALGGGGDDPAPTLDQIISREPTPEFAAQAAEECRRLLDLLGDAELESIAVWRMEGYTVEQIAQRTGYVPRTITRKMNLIRTLWEQEFGP
jgi:DNA-directed RNA polymerase specialized sigma24 family protein